MEWLLVTILLCAFAGAMSGGLSYRFAILHVQREINRAFSDHVALHHADHERFVSTVNSDEPDEP